METQEAPRAPTEPTRDDGADGLKKPGTGFVSSAVALSSATAVAQVVAVLISPILSRLFMPDAFGVAALYGAVVGPLGLVACLCYHFAIMLPKDDETVANVFGLCVMLAVGVTALTAGAVALFGDALLNLVNASELIPYKWLIPLGVLITGMSTAVKYWHTRHNRFVRLGVTTVASSLVNAGAMLGFGFWGLTSGLHLVLARLPGQASLPVYLGWRFIRQDLAFCLRHWSPARLWEAAKRYKKFPLITTWTQLLNTVSRQAPVLLIAAFFGPAAAGLYALGGRVLGMPKRLIATSISQVFFQRGALKRASGDDLGSLVRNIATRLITVGLLPMLIVGMVGPDLFGFVFGEDWTEAGVYATILAPWLFVMFVSSPLSSVLMILERQGLQSVLVVLLFGIRVGALLAGALFLHEARLALLLFSLGATASTALAFGIYVRLTGAGLGRIIRHLLRQLLYSLPTVALLAGLKWGLGVGRMYIAAASVIASLPYIVIALQRDAELRSVLRKAFGRILGKQ